MDLLRGLASLTDACLILQSNIEATAQVHWQSDNAKTFIRKPTSL